MNTTTWQNKFDLLWLPISLLIIFSSTTPVFAQTVSDAAPEAFPDVRSGNQYYVGIKYLHDQNLVNGYPDGLFRPTSLIKRAEALKVLGSAVKFHLFDTQERPLGSLQATPEIETIACPFPDLDKQAWYYSYICDAFHNQVVSGYPDGNFKPEQTINKVEALKMSILQSGLSTNIEFNDNFNDLTPLDWFWDYGRLANKNNFFVEDKSGNINPSQTMNRGDFSLLIYRILRSIQNNSEFGRATYYGGRFNGQGTANGETFSTYDLTAAHKTLPFDTIVKVTNLANGKSVTVRINDRGPYVNGAIIDLSTVAFTQIASQSTGVINVEVEIVNP